jgi:site-specific DNA recombinase
LRLIPQTNYRPQIIPTRIEVHDTSLILQLPVKFLHSIRKRLSPDERAEVDQADPKYLKLTLAIQMQRHGGKYTITGSGSPIPRPDPILIKALRAAHSLIETDRRGLPLLNAAPSKSYKRLLVRLAFLAPDIQEGILAGKQPPGFTLERLIHGEIPGSWKTQRRQFGWTN